MKLKLPKNVEIKVSNLKNKIGETYQDVITIFRKDFFELNIFVKSRNSVIRGDTTAKDLKSQSKFTFVVVEKAVFNTISSQHELTEQYQSWVKSIFSRLKQVFNDEEETAGTYD